MLVWLVLISAKTKTLIADSLLTIANDKYRRRFAQYGVQGFEPTNPAMYDRIREVLNLTKDHSLYPAYY